MTMTVPNYLQKILPAGQLPQDLPGHAWPWLSTLRENALHRYLQQGLPRPSEEEWRYTNLFGLEKNVFEKTKHDEADVGTIPSFVKNAAARLVFVDGRFRPELSDKGQVKGLRLSSLRQKLEDNEESIRYAFPSQTNSDSWHDINLALFEDGAVVEVAPHTHVTAPLEIITLFTEKAGQTMRHMRPLMHVGEGAHVELVEYVGGHHAVFTSVVTQVLVEKNATLKRIGINRLGADATCLTHENIRILAGGTYKNTLLQAGGKITRQKSVMALEERNANAILNLVTIASQKRHVDVVTDMRHAAPHTQSQQNIRALAIDEGKSIFQGRIVVEQPAQKTNATQNHHGLLLSPSAEIDTKPALEIYADDVKCGHGTTCGALDDSHLFYLRSRGIPKAEAEEMLISAFMTEMFEGAGDMAETLMNLAREARRGM